MITREGVGVGSSVITTPADRLWHRVVIIDEPTLACAVITPALLTDRTVVSLDCQFVQVAVMSRVVPSERTPSTLARAVAPVVANERKSSEKEKMAAWNVVAAGETGDPVVGDDEPHATVNRPAATRPVRNRFLAPYDNATVPFSN